MSQIQPAVQKPGITQYLSSEKMQDYLRSVIGNHKDKFVTNLVSAVNQNKALQECNNMSLVSGALVASTLNLSLNSSFGYAYLVPYKKKDRQGNIVSVDAQFQIGYKGYIQLAMRTGEYRRLNAVPVYKNQFVSWNRITEDLKLNDVEPSGEVHGYVAFFKLNNGFEKTMYWTHDEMMHHADTYSQAFKAKDYVAYIAGKIPDKDLWKFSSFWYKDFTSMALKTMLRQLLSKYGILSEEMQKAYEFDQSVVVDEKPVYVDTDEEFDREFDAQPEQKSNLESMVNQPKSTTEKPSGIIDIEEVEHE